MAAKVVGGEAMMWAVFAMEAAAETRRFADASTGGALQVPSNQDVPMEVTLLSVCRTRRATVRTSAENRKIAELWCR